MASGGNGVNERKAKKGIKLLGSVAKWLISDWLWWAWPVWGGLSQFALYCPVNK